MIFSVAFVMTGLSSTYAHMADNSLALATGVLALLLLVTLFSEAQRER